MITVSNVSLSFGGQLLFKDVDLKFTNGNCYGIIGANGAGKSTFLKILCGEIEPTTGEVVISKEDRLSVLRQDHFAFDEYTVLETVIMGNKRLYEIMKEKDELYAKEDFTEEDGDRAGQLESEFAELNGWEAESDASKLIQGLGLSEDILYSQMSTLSGNEKVKVLLAQALFGNPDIIMLDEPTNHLDIDAISWLEDFLAENLSFTLPVADKPKLDDEFYQADGRYTAEGIAKGFSPAVVSIEVYKNSGGYVAAGQGSGVIMSADGYIVTNAHVVNAAESGIKVVLSDNSEYEAKVVGQDPATDIAVIKIQAQGLQAAEAGDSPQVNAGEEVVAIGSPAGYYGTVTKGIVSGVNRRIRLENSSIIMNCIQIDAAINPGNSGGALFNMWGQVIGITSSKLASSDYEGIGFAVSIDEAKPVIEELMEKGYVAGRVKIGVTYYAVSDTTAEIYGIKPGICIVSINSDCDVANTDLAEGDIITEIDGKSTAGEVDIASLFSGKQAGDEVVCKVYRKTDSGDEKEFEIKFKLMADNGGLVADSQAVARHAKSEKRKNAE